MPKTLRKKVFASAGSIIIAIALWTLISPTSAANVLGTTTAWIGKWFGWFYILLGTLVVVFIYLVAFSKYGRLRFGPATAQPEYSNLAWASMLFAAGIGTDLMFFAVAEPVAQYLHPPLISGGTDIAAKQAPIWAIFHYGLTGWAMYALVGMVLGYYTYRRHRPIAARTMLEPIFGKQRMSGIIGDIVDGAAIIGAVFGVAATLGIGVVQINVGLNLILGIQKGLPAQILLISLAIIMATISATVGITKGMKFLSLLNVYGALFLLLWVLVYSRTDLLLNALVMNIGDLAAAFPSMTMDTMAWADADLWKNSWTLFFWAWWVAWASFVGMFLARISYGRTIRQFVLGATSIPLFYIVFWISIFGNASIDHIRNSAAGKAFGEATLKSPELGLYQLLTQLPLAPIIIVLATLVGLLFYVTSADSGALVMANLCTECSDPAEDAAGWLRIFWALVTGLLTVGMLVVGGIPALQSAAVIMGLPFAVVLALAMYGFYKELQHTDHELAEEEIRPTIHKDNLPQYRARRRKLFKRRLPHKPRSHRVKHLITAKYK
ncbi:BCCT family transporter [Arcanobacterium hippocoleae]|uniref:Choline/glycine/proline betaine transport protein n=1 Tax=Arcanobacterium hippocoleae TaxID=149017 RepID=A0ABU1T340_9ACTO|nr:BCCT family transporter [Arcanobacterium hippocoleae]MDR6939783.1 choline/glycine/proline betaine transport protein [Arcanobacterium hippocoleae]